MAHIDFGEKRTIEKYLGMGDGNLLNFGHSTLQEFIYDVTGIDIKLSKYQDKGTSKANLMRSFMSQESESLVAKLLDAMNVRRDDWESDDQYNRIDPDPKLKSEFIGVIERLRGEVSVTNAEVIAANNEDDDFHSLAKHIQESIDKDEPAGALDRLHTFLMKYFREMCSKYAIAVEKNESLNAIYGKYVKALRSSGAIKTDMTEKILRSTFQCFDAFNDVRNNNSYAHDNPVLNHDESALIFNYMTATLKFLKTIEPAGAVVKNDKGVNWATF
ncbi:MAG TPA: abortive infection family protein [Mucilaginibacter sp.]|jgi:hypothetical protein